MWTQPSELRHAWRLAHVEAVESGHALLLHLAHVHYGGEFLPLQHALQQGYATPWPGSHCTLSIGSEATTWLLAQCALNAHPRWASDQARYHILHWLGATAGMQTCLVDTLASHAIVNGVGQGLYGEAHHVQRALAPTTSLDRSIALPQQFVPDVTQALAPETTDWAVSRMARSTPITNEWASWLGFLVTSGMCLFGFTQFLLRFL